MAVDQEDLIYPGHVEMDLNLAEEETEDQIENKEK
jgi:hypothetical protein